MRSQLDVRLGAQEPTIHHQPPDVHSLADAEEAIELADAYGVCDGFPLADSQKITLRGALATREDGSWAATRIGDFGPRQGTGKNDKIAARELAGLILFGDRLIIHTAHEFSTANESFLRLVSLFENWDDLRKKVERIRYANGEQGIELLSGQRLKYRARTGGAGRGFAKADLVVYDEAQHLSREHVAASGPTKLANPNSQTWYAGSGGLTSSAVAWEMRRAAVMGSGGRLAYTEMTAETVAVVEGKIQASAPDPAELDAWYRAMPGLGRWVTEESMTALFDELGPDLFARECLCVWDPEPGSSGGIIDPATWSALAVADHRPDGVLHYALDVSPQGASAAVGVSDGVHVECVKHDMGTAWVVPLCVARRDRFRELVIDPAGPAVELIAPLEAEGLTVRRVSTEDAKAACGQFLTDVTEGRAVHRGQPMLDQAVQNADKRDVGDGGWLWSRKRSSVDISPLYAVTLAKWAAGATAPVPTPGFVDLSDFED
jgi:hypothetical protein